MIKCLFKQWLYAICFFPISFFIVNAVNAQHYDITWAKGIGGKGADKILSITEDKDKNIYICGVSTSDSIDVDPGPGTALLLTKPLSGNNTQRIFIAKYDSMGKYLWANQIDSTQDRSESDNNYVSVDKVGNVFLLGTTATSGNASGGRNGKNKMFIVKYDINGVQQWIKKVQGTAEISGKAIQLDNTEEHIYLCGLVTSAIAISNNVDSLDVDPGPSVHNIPVRKGTYSLLKLKAVDGSFVWERSIFHEPTSIAKGQKMRPYVLGLDNNNNLIISGTYQGAIDFDPGPNIVTAISSNSGSQSSQFVTKLDAEGNFQWVKSFDAPETSYFFYPFGIATDNKNNIYLTGTFGDPAGTADYKVDFDPGPQIHNLTSKAGGYDMYVLKLDTQGQFNWVTQLGSPGAYDLGWSIDVQVDKLLLSGVVHMFSDTMDFDPGPEVHNALIDTSGIMKPFLYINILDTAGNFEYARLLSNIANGGFNHEVSDIKWSSNQSILFAGVYTGNNVDSINIDPSPGNVYKIPSFGTDDIFIARLERCSIYDTIDINACGSFTYNHITYTQSGNYSDTLIQLHTCDSFVQLKINIYHNSLDTLDQTICADSFMLGDATFFNSGEYLKTFNSAMGCDSSVFLRLALYPAINKSVSQNGHTLIALATNVSYQWLRCDNNWATIPDATQSTFNPEENGSYAVLLTGRGGCIDTSACITVTGIVAIRTIEENQQWDIYPNPGQNSLFIKFSERTNKAEIRIRNTLGQVLQQVVIENPAMSTLDISKLAPGSYTIELLVGEKYYTRKLVKMD